MIPENTHIAIMTLDEESPGYLKSLLLDGFQKQNMQKCVKEISIRKVIDVNEYDDIGLINQISIQHSIIEELAQNIIENNLAQIYESTSFNTNEKVLTAHINIVEPGVKYSNLIEDVFKVSGEVFTNEELVKAVKNLYPERLV